MRAVQAAGGRKRTVGVVGGTGHTGGELCRLLLDHPDVGTVLPTSRDGGSVDRVHPNLLGSGLAFVSPDELAARAGELDAVLFSTPTGEAMAAAGHYLDRGVPVVDLSADFRFDDAAEFRRVHGVEHAAPGLLGEAVYGLTELRRADVAAAKLVANPGCYAITALLALVPLLTGLADADVPDRIAVHSVNGTTGAGVTPKRDLMHAEVVGALLPYGLDGHRHAPEIENVLARHTGREVEIDLTTAHGDFARGIHLQASVPLAPGTTREDLLERYRAHYGAGADGEFFVRVNDQPRRGGLNAKDYALYPTLRGVVGSNFCHLGVDVDPRLGVARVVAVTDNLVKGAAGSAIQNLNVVWGLDERTGLGSYAL